MDILVICRRVNSVAKIPLSNCAQDIGTGRLTSKILPSHRSSIVNWDSVAMEIPMPQNRLDLGIVLPKDLLVTSVQNTMTIYLTTRMMICFRVVSQGDLQMAIPFRETCSARR